MNKVKTLSRRKFIRGVGALGVAAGIVSFPPGEETLEVLGQDILQVTRTYPRVKIIELRDLIEGDPFDFHYPQEAHQNFVVKLAQPANGGVGSDQDIVAFNYACTHQGCFLNNTYHHEHTMLGPCSCHFTRFDLSKNGIVILGQATQSLPQIMLEIEAGDIYATGVRGLIYGYRDNLEDGALVEEVGV